MIAPKSQTIRSFYEEFYRPLKLRSRSHNTRRLYEFSIRNFSHFLCREATLADFNDETIGRLLGWLVDRGLSPYTVNKERSQLLAIWRFACRKGLIAIWPDVDPEIQPERIPRAWTADELGRLFSACLETPGTFGPVPRNLWWYGLHLVGWDTGERIRPLLLARWNWLELSAGVLRVPAEARKGRRADRAYGLHADTMGVLVKIREHAMHSTRKACDFIFSWPYSATYIYACYEKIQRRAGLPVGRQFRFHCLRKSVASHGAAAGLDPQQLMGHIDGRTTRKYLDPTICGGKTPAEVLFRPQIKKSAG